VSEDASKPKNAYMLRCLAGISVRYRIPHERYATPIELALRWLKWRIRYDDYLALRNIREQVRKGEMLGSIGSSVAGKSTLLKVVTGVLKAKRGLVWMCFSIPYLYGEKRL
jgi:ABC-type polysaccharide/polyol phosphate transport system ATPase subunit